MKKIFFTNFFTVKFSGFCDYYGEGCVFFLSQDDKARVPLGLPAANKQVRVVMHLQYRIKLPDHDFVVAEKHKLIPSVYAACKILDEKVSYNGALGSTRIYLLGTSNLLG